METLAYIDLTLAYEAPASTTPVFTQDNLKHCNWFNRQNLSRYARRYLPPLFVIFSMFPMAGEAFVQILKEGSQGPLVTQLQARLLVLNYFDQKPTGYFGSKTKDAVMQFQREYRLNRDGVVGEETWSALFGTSLSNPNLSSQPYFSSSDTDYPLSSTRELDYSQPPFPNNPEPLPPPPHSIPIRTSRFFPEQPLPSSNFPTPRSPDDVSEVYSGRILQREARGEDVERLQQALRVHGFNPGSINSIYGEDTENAVMEFQRFHNFHVDGVAGNETLKALGLMDGNLTSQPNSGHVVCP